MGEELEVPEEVFTRLFCSAYSIHHFLFRLVEFNSSNSFLFLVIYDFRP